MERRQGKIGDERQEEECLCKERRLEPRPAKDSRNEAGLNETKGKRRTRDYNKRPAEEQERSRGNGGSAGLMSRGASRASRTRIGQRRGGWLGREAGGYLQ